MPKVFFVQKKLLKLILATAVIITALVWWYRVDPVMPASGAVGNEREIHLTTVEYNTTLQDGREMEIYRFAPDTVHVKKGENVKLRMFGFHGASHPFVIEGLNIRGEIKKGQETVVQFQAKKRGIYRMICTSHNNHSPMIGYIIVD